MHSNLTQNLLILKKSVKKNVSVFPFAITNKSGTDFLKIPKGKKGYSNQGGSLRNVKLDKDFGKIKAKFGGSSAGHNGIESIDKFIGKDYSRVRIGVGNSNGEDDAAKHVLKDFDEEEKTELENITKNITNSLTILLDKKLELFSSTVNNK